MSKSSLGRASAKVAVAALVAAVVVPQGVGTASAGAAHKLPRPKHQRISTAGRTPSSQLLSNRTVTAMLELSQKPAALSFRASLSKGLTAARSASKAQNAVVERQSASVASAAKGIGSTKVLYRVSRLYSGVAVQTTMRDIPALRALRGVAAVHVMTAKSVTNANSVPLIHAPQQWDSGAAGTGQGVTVGIIDTGIDYTHANFGGPGTVGAYTTAKAADASAPSYPDTAKVAGGYDFAGDAYDPANGVAPTPDTNPLDCEGHGSHVAGTVAGYGVTQDGATYSGPYDSSVDFNQFKLDEVTKKVGIGPGVAPKATLYALKVFGCEGSTNLVTEALDWAADPNGDGDISDHLDVVNMSLGSDYSSPDDPDAVASNNASLAGVTVVASAGNGGDLTDIAGAPGNATRAIAVAATDDGYGVFDGVRVETPPSIAGLKVAERSAAYDWATEGGLTTPTEIVAIGDWGQDASASNNTDGCSPFSASDKAKVLGKVVLLKWTDVDANRRCGSAGRGAQARAAGAVGAVLANDEENFSAGITGDSVIPEEIVVKSAGDDLKASIDNAEQPTVTLRYADRNSTSLTTPADTPASFTSRGRRGNGGLKPDVAAPGISVFSTAVGTGSEGVSENGTSMAAPHVAGVAALVKAAHHGWTPEEVKAAIMDTALTDVVAGGHTYSPTRVGSGRVDAQKAASADLLAYTTSDPGAVSLGFGTIRAVSSTTVSKTLHVVNKTGSARTIDVSYDAIQDVAGASVSVTPSTLTLDPADGADVVVKVTVLPSVLRAQDPTMPSTDPASGAPEDFVTELTGRVQLSESGTVKAQVPLEATPRAASAMTGSAASFAPGATSSTTLNLTGTSVTSWFGNQEGYLSLVDGLELQGVDERLPDCGGGFTGACVPFPSARAGDMRYTAAGSTVPADVSDGVDPYDPNVSSSYAYFGVTAWDKWATPASFSEYDVWIDTNNDHKPDYVTYNTRFGASDVMVAETDVLNANGVPVDVADIELINDYPTSFVDTAKFDDESLVMPVWIPALGLSSTRHRINWWVQSGSIETGYIDADATASAPHSFDVAQPGLALTDDPASYPTQAPSTLFLDDSSSPLKVTKSTPAYNADKAQGLWLFHTLNTDGNRAQVLRIKQNQVITVPAAAKVVHYAKNGRFTLNTTSTSGLPVSVQPQTGTTCYYSGGYVVPRAAGTCTVKWVQAGNADYNAASVTASFRIIGESVTTLASSDSVAPASQAVTLTATVTRKYATTLPLTGTVYFYDGSRLMGHATLYSNGKSYFRLPVLSRGTHYLHAVYASTSAYYTGSTSAARAQVVS